MTLSLEQFARYVCIDLRNTLFTFWQLAAAELFPVWRLVITAVMQNTVLCGVHCFTYMVVCFYGNHYYLVIDFNI